MKIRLDEILIERELVDSINKARSFIMQGLVFVDGEKIDKAGHRVSLNSDIFLNVEEKKYVSRGGYKLEKAIRDFSLDLKDKIAMDIGSSTGGFTDCMLKNGAKKVYAVDVGYGQLDWKLRDDPRVEVMERTNIRYVTRDDIADRLDFFTADVSFISLDLVLPVIDQLMSKDARALVLVKPQFEARREEVGEGGIIRDREIHLKVLEEFQENVIKNNFTLEELTYSPITGASGNIEYLALLKKDESDPRKEINIDIENIVDLSHKNLSK